MIELVFACPPLILSPNNRRDSCTANYDSPIGHYHNINHIDHIVQLVEFFKCKRDKRIIISDNDYKIASKIIASTINHKYVDEDCSIVQDLDLIRLSGDYETFLEY